ncbi:MAG: GTPase HflX [Planctomycetota bacterium]|nr:GTPase HflX [Planctomycetota bacterium]
MKGELHDAEVRPPVAVLFGRAGRTGGEDVLDELAGLAEAADVGVAGRLVQSLQRPLSATYIGSGKVEELRDLVKACHAELVLADVDLSPAQARNLTKAVGVRVVDRSELIMDIFARRARTAQAKLQVELAQLKYMLPRLRGQWVHLDRYRGGGVGTRGPGEKQLETDRRLVNKRIGDLQARLEVYERRTQLNLAGRSSARKVALAGYTNTGKSTLFNRLTGADRLAVNRLFATLDTRTRKWPVPGCEELILSDTVGFVASLPHHLVASFHATLEEVVEADLVLHIVDASGPHVRESMEAVMTTLKDIGAADIETLCVFNKVDLIADTMELQALLNAHPGAVVISARTGQGLEDLSSRVAAFFVSQTQVFQITIPIERGRALALAGELGELISSDADTQCVRVCLRVEESRIARLKAWAASEGLLLEPARIEDGAANSGD